MMSALPRIVLQKSFLAGDGNFLEPLMRFARGDVRVHIGSHKNDHGPPYPSYRALQRRRRLKIDFREIFGVARFSTFATLSARNGRAVRAARLPLVGVERTSFRKTRRSESDPYATSADSLCRRDGVVQAHKAAEDHRVISRQPMHRFKASKCHPFTGA